jgi:predicted PurR-regulated permease PerM
MEIIYFLSGVGAVLLFLSVVFVSGLASRISELENQVKNLIQCVNATNQEISNRDEDVHRRIDQEIDRTNKMTEELEKTVSFEVKEIYSTIDSRLDKLEQKFSKQVIKG